jgi:hypothetical protein
MLQHARESGKGQLPKALFGVGAVVADGYARSSAFWLISSFWSAFTSSFRG